MITFIVMSSAILVIHCCIRFERKSQLWVTFGEGGGYFETAFSLSMLAFFGSILYWNGAASPVHYLYCSFCIPFRSNPRSSILWGSFWNKLFQYSLDHSFCNVDRWIGTVPERVCTHGVPYRFKLYRISLYRHGTVRSRCGEGIYLNDYEEFDSKNSYLMFVHDNYILVFEYSTVRTLALIRLVQSKLKCRKRYLESRSKVIVITKSINVFSASPTHIYPNFIMNLSFNIAKVLWQPFSYVKYIYLVLIYCLL